MTLIHWQPTRRRYAIRFGDHLLTGTDVLRLFAIGGAFWAGLIALALWGW